MEKAEDLFTVFNFDTKFQTRTHYLEIKVSDTDILESYVGKNKVVIKIPQSNKIEDIEVQN